MTTALGFALTQALVALTPDEASQKVAEAAGVNDFDQVEQIEFTFHVDFGDRQISRSWQWQPQERKVALIEAGEVKHHFDQDDLNEESGEELLKADSQFVNDSYWLLFPFQVAWDDSVEVVAIPEAARQEAAGEQRGFRVKYPKSVGYTPGDVYDVYYDDKFMVTMWAYFPGGAETPKMATRWLEYEAKGPLKISLNRPSPEKPFRVWFTDVVVKTSE